jgi:hypothetical protein
MFTRVNHGIVSSGYRGDDPSPVFKLEAIPDPDTYKALGQQITTAVMGPLHAVVNAWRKCPSYERWQTLIARQQSEKKRHAELIAEVDRLAEAIIQTFTTDAYPDELERKRDQTYTQSVRVKERIEALAGLVKEARQAAEQLLRKGLLVKIGEMAQKFSGEVGEANDTFLQALSSYADLHVAHGCRHAVTDRAAIADIQELAWPEELRPEPDAPPPGPAVEKEGYREGAQPAYAGFSPGEEAPIELV